MYTACWTGMEAFAGTSGDSSSLLPQREYVRPIRFLPPRLPLDYLKRYGFGYRHILRIDTHQPWTSPAICEVVERIGPDYLGT